MANNVDPSKIATLQEAMTRASKLMKLTANGTIDKIAEKRRGDVNDYMTNENTQIQLSSLPKQSHTAVYNENMIKKSNIPKVIQESFLKTANSQTLSSQHDDLYFLNKDVIKEETVKDSIPSAIMESSPQSSNTIDYPTIRMIVEDIVRKYTSSLKNKLLTENREAKTEIKGIMLGESFKFVASNGDIYEAKLKKIGNIKNKK